MRTIPASLQARLDGGVTTLAQAWKLTRSDGVVLGFTDHDDDLVFDGVTFRAGSRFAAAEAASRFDLAPAGGEVAGAFDSTGLTTQDLAGGRYDGADIETWLVDWQDVAARMLIARGFLGEVKQSGDAFVADLRGLADLFAQERGRIYAARCSADLGDGRCRIDLADPARHGNGAVGALQGAAMFAASGLGGFADGVFTAGRLQWTSGANLGLAREVKLHRAADGEVTLALWQAMPAAIVAGDAFTVTAGCDKTLATCRDRFANTDNFRGFPQMPGNDFIIAYPLPGSLSADSGASLVG